MSSNNDVRVTVVGWAASTPREATGTGTPFTSFRLATTPRRYDARQGGWIDGRTEWLTVKAFRDAAFNIAASIRKGDPVIAYGRLMTEEWSSDNGTRTSLVLDATSVGHDLTRGRSSFARTVRESVRPGGTDAHGSPDAEIPLPDDEPPAEDPWEVDGATFEAAGEAAQPASA